MRVEREMVARQYTREKLLPQITIPRYELRKEYRRNLRQYSTEGDNASCT